MLTKVDNSWVYTIKKSDIGSMSIYGSATDDVSIVKTFFTLN